MNPEQVPDDYAEFEKELEAVLALDPIERIQRYESISQRLEQELDTIRPASEQEK